MGATVKYDNLVKLEGLHYYKFTAEPLTGKKQGSFKEDKKDSPWVSLPRKRTVDEKNTGTFKEGVKVK